MKLDLKQMVKFLCLSKCARIAKIIWPKKKKRENLLYMTKHYNARVIKTIWFRHSNKQNSTENSEIDSSIYGYAVYKRSGIITIINGQSTAFQLIVFGKKVKLDPSTH